MKSIFFRRYEIIENVHSIGSWFCICHQYSGCQLIKDFVKRQKDIVVFVNFKTDLIFGN